MTRVALPIQLVLLATLVASAIGFAALPTARSAAARAATAGRRPFPPLDAESSSNDGDDKQEDKLAALGFTESEISRSSRPSESPNEDLKVRVNLVDDVDPVTLTAIGFGLIAANFLIFANMGSGGIAGIVARLINYFG